MIKLMSEKAWYWLALSCKGKTEARPCQQNAPSIRALLLFIHSLRLPRGQYSPCNQLREELHPIAQFVTRRDSNRIGLQRPLISIPSITVTNHHQKGGLIHQCESSPLVIESPTSSDGSLPWISVFVSATAGYSDGGTAVYHLMLWVSNLSFSVTATVSVQWRSECLSNCVSFPQWHDVFSFQLPPWPAVLFLYELSVGRLSSVERILGVESVIHLPFILVRVEVDQIQGSIGSVREDSPQMAGQSITAHHAHTLTHTFTHSFTINNEA